MISLPMSAPAAVPDEEGEGEVVAPTDTCEMMLCTTKQKKRKGVRGPESLTCQILLTVVTSLVRCHTVGPVESLWRRLSSGTATRTNDTLRKRRICSSQQSATNGAFAVIRCALCAERWFASFVLDPTGISVNTQIRRRVTVRRATRYAVLRRCTLSKVSWNVV